MKSPRVGAALALASLLLSPAASAQEFLAVDDGGTLLIMDGASGCSTGVFATLGLIEINAMAKRPSDGNLFLAGGWSAVTTPVLYEIDGVTGALVGSVTMNGINSVRGLAFDPAGNLYVAEDQGTAFPDDLWVFDESTGAGTLIGPIASFNGVQALTWDPAGQQLFGWDVGNGTCLGAGLIYIDPATGAASDPSLVCGVTGNCWDVQGLTVDASGQLWGVGEYLRRIDSATGCTQWVGTCLLNYLRGVEPYGAFEIASVGSCPSGAQIDVRGGTPAGSVGLAWSAGTAGAVVPSGSCAGTAVGIGPGLAVVGFRTLDAQGAASFGPQPVPAGACGGIWLQALDLGSCQVSNLTQL